MSYGILQNFVFKPIMDVANITVIRELSASRSLKRLSREIDLAESGIIL
jgi:hypothetical protein